MQARSAERSETHLLRTPTPWPTPDTIGAASTSTIGASQRAAPAHTGRFQRRGGLPRRRMRRWRSRRPPPRTQGSASADSANSSACSAWPWCSVLIARRVHQWLLHAGWPVSVRVTCQCQGDLSAWCESLAQPRFTWYHSLVALAISKSSHCLLKGMAHHTRDCTVGLAYHCDTSKRCSK